MRDATETDRRTGQSDARRAGCCEAGTRGTRPEARAYMRQLEEAMGAGRRTDGDERAAM
jgi:hypothetical protein